MLAVARDLQTQYEKALDSASVSRELRPHFRKWLRFYLDFCSKYEHSPRSKSSVPLFMAKLASKNQRCRTFQVKWHCAALRAAARYRAKGRAVPFIKTESNRESFRHRRSQQAKANG